MSEYEAAVQAWNRALDMIRAVELQGRRVPESWMRRADDLYRDAARAEQARQGASQLRIGWVR